MANKKIPVLFLFGGKAPKFVPFSRARQMGGRVRQWIRREFPGKMIGLDEGNLVVRFVSSEEERGRLIRELTAPKKNKKKGGGGKKKAA